MYGDKSKKWIMLCFGSILFFCIVCVIYMIDVSKRWDNVWGMNGRVTLYMKMVQIIHSEYKNVYLIRRNIRIIGFGSALLRQKEHVRFDYWMNGKCVLKNGKMFLWILRKY